MITKNTKYHGTPNVTLLEYGTGDIITNNLVPGEGDATKYTGITCRNATTHPIGTDHPADYGKTVTELQPDVVFTFTRVESIDVLLGMLHHARKDLLEMLSDPAALPTR